MHKHDYKDIFFKTLLLYIMILTLSMGIKDYFVMEISFIELALYDFALVFTVTVLYCFPQVLGLGIAVFMVASIYMKYYHSQIFGKLLQDCFLFLQWLLAYTAGYAVFLEEYSIPFLISVLVFSVGLLSILVFSKSNKLIITAIGIVVFSFFWFTYVEKAKLYLIIFIFSSLILHSYSLWEKKIEEWKSRDLSLSISFYRNWIGSALLLIGFSLIFMLLLPLNIRPLRVAALNDFMVQNFPFIEQWKNNSEENYGYSFRFSLSDAVYKGKKLGGPVSYDGSLMLSLRGDLKNNLYLRGSVYDKYSGFNWSKLRKSSELYDKDAEIDIPIKAEFSELEIEIKPERLTASTLFSPLYPVKIEHDDDKIFINDDMEIYARKLIDSNTAYKIKSKIPLLSEEMLRRDEYDADSDANKLYLRLPQNISDRLKKLVEELAKSKNNPYDKAKAIEEYLRKNYSYTLNPGKIPEGKDFIDYFLFEGKEGYCTYYASTMAVMLRLAGIPSRYVEGFLVKSEGQGTKIYNILDKNAHAWVEAYFGEFGWVTFEPTPAYEQVEPWKSWADDSIDKASQSSTDSLPSFSRSAANKTDRQKELMEEDIYIGEGLGNKVNNEEVPIKVIALILITLVLFRMIYGFVRVNVLRFVTFKNSKKFADLYIKQIFWMLSKAYKGKGESETFREFLFSVYDSFEIDKNDFEFIVSIVEGIIYGEKIVKADEAYKLKEFSKRLRENIKVNQGMMKYIWNFYLGKP